MCTSEREIERVCVHVHALLCLCFCVCVCERESERESSILGDKYLAALWFANLLQKKVNDF
mgnify:CR=1 FL=1